MIVASKGGADDHPDWYLNLRAAPQIDFQVATQAFRASWREPEGIEREKVWEFMVEIFPPYGQYRASTTRRIPMTMMKPVETLEVFRESDNT